MKLSVIEQLHILINLVQFLKALGIKVIIIIISLFYVSLNPIYCIVVSSLLFSPSIYKSCFVIRLQLPPPRLVYKLFAGRKVM